MSSQIGIPSLERLIQAGLLTVTDTAWLADPSLRSKLEIEIEKKWMDGFADFGGAIYANTSESTD